jgi:hypothetical protein
MKKFIATAGVLASLAFASSAAAQTQYNNPNDQTLAGASAPSTLKVSGTVVSSDANQIVVRADNGTESTILVNASTAEPKLFTAGDRVTVTYTSSSSGNVAKSIADLGRVTATTTTTTTVQTPPLTQTAPAPMASATTTIADADVDRSVQADIDDDETMPATASPLALIALLGLGAAGAATAVRRKS